MDDSNIITYSLEFSCVNSTCTGTSIADIGGENETKSELVGEIEFSENKVYFQEINTIYTKARKESYNEICLLEFNFNLDKLISERNQELKSSFNGFFSDKMPCLRGTIDLKSKVFLAQKAERLRDKLNTKVAKKVLGDNSITAITKSLDSISNMKKEARGLSTNKIIDYDINNVLYLKDLGNNDGDIIRLIQQGTSLDINLTKKPYYLMNTSNSDITLIGVDEGKYPTIPIELVVKKFNEIMSREILVLRKNDTILIHLKS